MTKDYSIVYTDKRDFTEKDLVSLFSSVDWASAEHPEKLYKAIGNYQTVFAAYDDEKPVGMVCAMDDGQITAYIHYLLVDPAYQKYGIGKKLISLVKEHYAGFLRLVLVCYNETVPFYEKCGFRVAIGSTPMYITDMRN